MVVEIVIVIVTEAVPAILITMIKVIVMKC